MNLCRNPRPFCVVGVFMPTCSCSAEWEAAAHDRVRTRSSSASTSSVLSASLRIKPVKLNAPVTFLDLHARPLALRVRRDSWGCQHPTPRADPSLSAPSCFPQGLPPAAVSVDAFPHQTRANSGCGAFSCSQAVLENSFALPAEVAQGIADSLGTTAVSQSRIQTPPDLIGQQGPGCVCVEDWGVVGAPSVPRVSVKTELEFSSSRMSSAGARCSARGGTGCARATSSLAAAPL